jgi:hypothetical protein
MRIVKSCLLFILVLIGHLGVTQNTYKISLFRATPGKLMQLIDVLKSKSEQYVDTNGEKPYILRHSQGDHWDLMVYEYIDDPSVYYSENGFLTKIFTPEYGNEFYDLIAFHENLLVNGSDYKTFSSMLESNDFFHVEMFVALPGKQKELLKERLMENDYLTKIGRDKNLIFTSIEGASWDNLTLGGYRDLKHFAESGDIPYEKEEQAALSAGFKGVADISPYLRSLIYRHNDTLANKVK